MLPVDAGGNQLLPLVFRHFEAVNVTGATALIQGTSENDTISVSAGGVVTVTNLFGFSNTIDVHLFNSRHQRPGRRRFDYHRFGGPSPAASASSAANRAAGSDTLTLNGTAADDVISVDLAASTVSGIVANVISTSGIEHLVVNGNGATVGDSITVDQLGATAGIQTVLVNANNLADSVTVNGTSAADILNFRATSPTSGEVTRTGTATTINYTSLTGLLTVDGGADGFDVLTVLGTEGDDDVTSTATTVTLTGTVAIGANINRLDINTFGSGDTVILTELTIDTIIDTGAGDDNVDLSGSGGATILSGTGNDFIIGSPSVDLIDAGAGDDFVVGGPGNDLISGGEGNDLFEFGPGDDADFVDGGAGFDVANYFDTAGQDDFITISAVGTQAVVQNNADQFSLTGIESLGIFNGDSVNGDITTIDSVAATDLTEIEVSNFGVGNPESLIINATNAANNVTLAAPVGLNLDPQFHGLGPAITVRGFAVPNKLSVNLLGGNDTYTADPAVAFHANFTVNGGNGDDLLTAFGTINGDAGNDTLIGSSGDETMDGGDGDDTFIGNGGTDTVTGGTGGDTILVQGTPGADVINLSMSPGGDLLVTVNGVTTTYVGIAGASIESINVLGLAGNDVLTVDSTNDGVPVPINFDGGANADSLILSGGTAVSDTYTPGPEPRARHKRDGLFVGQRGLVTQVVTFVNLEPVIDSVASPLVVNGNNANNAINFAGTRSALICSRRFRSPTKPTSPSMDSQAATRSTSMARRDFPAASLSTAAIRPAATPSSSTARPARKRSRLIRSLSTAHASPVRVRW